MEKIAATGLIIGKFMPPHLGHRYLVDFARRCVERLTVLVGSLSSEPIPGALRLAWMQEMFPGVTVLHHTAENPQYPEEHPAFWDIWRDSIRALVPTGPDIVFASEDYGVTLAEVLGARFMPVDRERALVPVSATAIRQDPLAHWAYLPSCVRPHFVKRVCVYGPESTGKSTLTRDLAAHFGTVYVAEYGRTLLDANGGRCTADDIDMIAHGHRASEEAMARQANRVLFSDTDTITTVLWSEILVGDCPAWIRELAERRRHDLHLLLDVDVPWVADPQRFLPDDRAAQFTRWRAELDRRGLPYVVIRGSWDERFATARQAVERLLRGNGASG
ncbi:MAG: AAA family ATPase [Alphaproteobacteria bacterium]